MQSRFIEFLKECDTVTVALVGKSGEPDVCHLPFVMDQCGTLFIFTSEIASHYKSLTESSHASLMLVSGQTAKMGGSFAKERCKLQCRVEGPVDEERDEILMGFSSRYGSIVEMLKGLKDFHVWKLIPVSGIFIQGFGAAYRITSPSKLPSKQMTGKHEKEARENA